MLYKEYDYVASMRLQFLASQRRRAEQFTVVVRSIPHVSGCSVSETVDHFFQTNHPSNYLCHQAVYKANKFAKLARKRDRLQNWLDYNLLKFERKQWQKTMEQTAEPDLNLKSYLADAYLHPIFRSFEEQELVEVSVDKHQTLAATPITSELSSPSPPHYARQTPPSSPQSAHYQSSPPQYVYNSNSSQL
ncbi:hypothetical protein PRUPE_3G145100 [Prunus persica]|uniref:CSC1/OSCA1-like cytosolic domain-containing protein n=1 Tax=Prunus persica TaxID=3760 RepID=A0A251Q050_PRUPE|nr:hypothetical protein PRUPE_3G145100 [Prunus persica]